MSAATVAILVIVGALMLGYAFLRGELGPFLVALVLAGTLIMGANQVGWSPW